MWLREGCNALAEHLPKLDANVKYTESASKANGLINLSLAR